MFWESQDFCNAQALSSSARREYDVRCGNVAVMHMHALEFGLKGFLLFSEIYHGQRWWTDKKYQAPMAISPCGHLYVGDFIEFIHPRLGKTSAKVLKFFLKVLCLFYWWFCSISHFVLPIRNVVNLCSCLWKCY